MEKSNNEQQNIMDKSMRSVFVGNIPYEATEEKLKDIFSEVGPVLSLKLVFDRETGKPKGYGFCEYKDQETALSAMRNLNGYEIGGRTLRVDNACTEKSRMEMQQLLQGPQVENPYGDPVPPDKAPEVISKVVSSLPPERLHIIVNEMRACIQQNPNEARTLLLRNPQLAYALLQAQVVMKFVDPKDALTFLYKPNEMPPVLLNHDIPDRPLGIGGVPIPVPLPPLNPNTIFSPGHDIDLRSVNGRSIDPRLHRGSEMPPVGPPNIGGIRGPPAPINSFPPRANATDPRLRPTLEPKSQPSIRPNNIAPDIVKPPPPMKGVHPLPPQPGNVSPGLYSGVLAVDASDQEKAALIMQVLQLSDEQIAMLPPEQRTSILILKEQIAKSTKR